MITCGGVRGESKWRLLIISLCCSLLSVVQMVPESQHDEESTAIIRVPEKSPLKSAMVDHTTRSKSPSPKRVAFAEVCSASKWLTFYETLLVKWLTRCGGSDA